MNRKTTRALRGLPVAAALATALVVAGCGTGGPSSTRSATRPNVLLILVDTLRAQELGLYGYSRNTSPNMARLARDGVLFEDARSQAPCTYPSANSILTGRHPMRFFGQKHDAMGIPSDIPSLAEILGDAGYATVAVSASPIVREHPTEFNPTGGFGRGFDLFEEHCLWAHAGCVNRSARGEIKVLRQPFFLYLHFMDPHSPLTLPDGWTPRIATEPYEGKKFVAEGQLTPIADRLYGPQHDPGIDARDLRHLVALYDEEIAYFDDQLGLLLDDMEHEGLLENTLIVLVADHGEELLEHGHIKHCHSLYDTEIKTPMIIRPPGPAHPARAAAGAPDLDSGPKPGKTIATQVANLAVAPTILDYAGIDPTPYHLEATSLRPVIEDGAQPGTMPVAVWGTIAALKQGRYKMILDLYSGATELYDLEADPGETADVQADHPDVTRNLRHAIRSWIRDNAIDPEKQLHEGETVQQRLKALGYLQ